MGSIDRKRFSDLRLLTADEIDAAHIIIGERGAWLIERGIEQFLGPYPLGT